MPESPPQEGARVEMIGYDAAGAPMTVTEPDAADVVAAEEKVRKAGGRVSFIRRWAPDRLKPPGISAEDFARFNELLASAIQRRVPLLEGVRELSRGAQGRRFQEALALVTGALERGEPPSEAFALERCGFPRLYGRLLQAGAAAGNLSDVLLALSRNIRASLRFRKGVFEAFVYPVLLFCVACGFLGAFAVVILQGKIAPVADSLGMEIPAVTALMTARTASGVLYLVILGALVALAFRAWRWMGRERVFRNLREAICVRLPFLGELYEALLWSNAADTLALLIRARVPAPLALRLTAEASGSARLSAALERLGAEAEKGKPLSQAAREDRAIPWAFTRSILAGEIGGSLADALSALADDYRVRYERKAQTFIRCLPPALSVILGVLVFLLALAVLAPYIAFWGAAW
ncbi:MAG: type II secretion system F family protein [Candidatus Brocadiia bacterium]